jgi:hypothetical protein
MTRHIAGFLAIAICAQIALSGEYIQNEAFTLHWAAEKEKGIPYSIDPEGIIRCFSDVYVDQDEGFYFSFFAKDFRKYDSAGDLIFLKDIYVDKFAVDDSLNVYFTEFNKNKEVYVIDKNGNIINKQYQYTINSIPQSVHWLKAIKGNIFLGFSSGTMQIYGNSLQAANNIYNKPFDKRGIYFDSETDMKKSNRSAANSYEKNFVNIYKFSYSSGIFTWLDTIKLDICSNTHQAAEVIHIDEFNNLYIWIFYDFDRPIDLVVLDSSFKEIERISMPIFIESMGTFISRPFINHDGAIYEFRAQKDGLHVIRWSRKE